MRRIILALVIVAMSFANVQTVSAKTYDLHIHNNTEENVKIKLKGDESYSFIVVPGKLVKTVKEDTYEVTYSACNGLVSFDKSVTVTSGGVWIVIDPCPVAKVETKFVINSNISESLTLAMSGPEEYELTIGLGKNKFLGFIAGTYTYSHDFCSIAVAGTIVVTKNGKTRLSLLGCEREEILSFGLPNPSNLRIGSHYAFPVTVTLIGPRQYYLTVNPGINRIDVIRGTYTYIYTAYNKIYSGEITVSGGGMHNTIIFSPLSPEP